MADSSPLAGLLDRAERVFVLAGELGTSFENEFRSRKGVTEPSAWSRHAATYKAFGDALLSLRDAMLHPPAQFEAIAELLLRATRMAGDIRKAREPAARACGEYAEFFPDLNSLCADGLRAIDLARQSQSARDDNPFAFAELALYGPVYSQLEDFPATNEGHIAFLERVRDEVLQAAEAKRNQLAEKYPNATVESMVRGIKWPEARQRLEAIDGLPSSVIDAVRNVLSGELTIGTVEQIAEVLRPVMIDLRYAWDNSRPAHTAPSLDCPAALLIELLHRTVRRLKAKPDVLRAFDWNQPDALNAENINAAARQVSLGPIFNVGVASDWAHAPNLPSDHPVNAHKIECLTVFHPNGGSYRVRRSGGQLSDLSDIPTIETLAYMQAWIARAEVAREQLDYERSIVEVTTVGDVWMAFAAGKRPVLCVSGICATPGSNIAHVTFPKPSDETRRVALEHVEAAVMLEGGDKGAAMERLIAKVQIAFRMDKATIINMPLVEFVTLLQQRAPSVTTAQLVDSPVKPASPATKQRKAKGRPKRDYDTIQKEKQTLDDWQQAKAAGRAKVDFAKERGMSKRDLDKLLDRVSASRRRRKD